jgi:hypothetical protein
MWRERGAALLGAVAVCLLEVPKAQVMELLGQAGVLGEWELTGNLSEGEPGPRIEFFGPLKMKHVGICTVDEPEQRAGDIRLQFADHSQSRVTANLVLDGVACTYDARKTHVYEGTMSCAGRAPVPLLVWLK